MKGWFRHLWRHIRRQPHIRGNGRHDDTAGLQYMLDNGIGLSPDSLPPGTYKVSDVLRTYRGERLIAAAPDLLRVVQMFEGFERGAEGGDSDYSAWPEGRYTGHGTLVDMARDAIAKATGEQP